MAIDSVITQSYGNWELIVVDDGSVDNTRALVEEYLSIDSRIKYFYQENQGPSVARNFGIDKSRGDYVTFLDSDDRFHPEKIEIQLDRLISSDVGFVVCGSVIYEGNRVIGYKKPKKVLCLLRSLLSLEFNGLAGTPLLLFRKALVENFGLRFDVNLNAMEDWDFLFQLASKSSAYDVVDECLYFETRHDQPHINTKHNKLRAYLFILQKYKDLFDESRRYRKVWELRAIRYYIYYFVNDGYDYPLEVISCRFRFRLIWFFNFMFFNSRVMMRLVIKLCFLDFFLFSRK